MTTMRLSATKLKTFMGCAKRYHYQYHGERSPATIPMIMGTAVHYAVERGYKDEEPARAYHTKWYEEIEKNERKHDQKSFQRGMDMVLAYDFNIVPLEIEHGFEIPFPIRGTQLCTMVGIFDQIFPWGVRDLKTGARKPNQLLLDNDLQFIIYGQAFEYLYGLRPERMVWLHMEKMEEMIAHDVYNPTKVDTAVRTIERLLEAEQTGVYDRHVGFECSWCPNVQECLGGAECQGT